MKLQDKLHLNDFQFEELERIYQVVENNSWHNKGYVLQALKRYYCEFFTDINNNYFDVMYREYEKSVQTSKSINLNALRQGGF